MIMSREISLLKMSSLYSMLEDNYMDRRLLLMKILLKSVSVNNFCISFILSLEEIDNSWFGSTFTDKYELMTKNKEDIVMMIKFMDAVVGDPKTDSLETGVETIQKFYLASQFLGFSAELSNDLLFKYARLTAGRVGGKIAIYKSIDEAFRYDN